MDANRVVPAEGRRRAPAKAGSDASVRQHNRVYSCRMGTRLMHTQHVCMYPCVYICPKPYTPVCMDTRLMHTQQ
jgi:hypothetical protein